jgi:SM-20-related protein
MPINAHHPLLLRIVDDLVEQGWSQQNVFLPQPLTQELAAECHRRAQRGLLQPAGVGRGDSLKVVEGVRGDHIQWLEAGQSSACDQYLEIVDALRQTLNQQLFVGLEDFECHFALYPVGAFYAPHLDRFRDDSRRAISVVLYLNEQWLPEHGGALRLHLDAGGHEITPLGGSLVVFRSDYILHEVLPAARERLSLVGWFRQRGQGPF